MVRLLACIVLLAASMGAGGQQIDYAALDVPVELRAIWIDAGSIPKSEAGIRSLVRTYHKANLNVLLPEVVARGYTVYTSTLVERDPRFAGCIDPLEIIIDEAHALGMEVHPWVWVFRAGYTRDRGAILRAHPDWVELSKFGEDLSANGGLWISPCIPAARDFLADLYAELVRNYDVDGIHLDYIRYEVQSPTPYGYNERCRRQFERQYGIDPLEVDRLSFAQYEWNRFRERQINTFVQRIALQTRAIRPQALVSAAVGSDPKTARLNLMQNWVNWVENKWVDFVTPMAYTNRDARFAELVSRQKAAVGNKTILAPGIGLHTQKDNTAQTVRQIGIARKLMTDGQSLFATAYFGEDQERALVQGPYSSVASVPFRNMWQRSRMLCDLAVGCGRRGRQGLAHYFSTLVNDLAAYAAYRGTPSGYVPPTEPPLDIPEHVIPLPRVEIPRTASGITIDGNLDDAAWDSAAKVRLSYTNEGEPAPVGTTAMLTWDESNFYVAFECEEPHVDRIKADVENRDGPTFYDDSVEVFVDPTRSGRDYFHFSTNTLGAQFDQRVFNAGWNGEWQSAVNVDKRMWTAEIAIPFATLGVGAPASGSQWGLNLTRNRTTSGGVEYLTWAVPYGSFHSPDRFGTAVFE